MAKVFILDDDVDNLLMFEDIIQALGHSTKSAAVPVNVVDVISDYDPDLILLDISLPGGMSGIDICDDLRQIPKFADTPIFALTANPIRYQEKDTMTHGFTEYFTKPLSPKALRMSIQESVM